MIHHALLPPGVKDGQPLGLRSQTPLLLRPLGFDPLQCLLQCPIHMSRDDKGYLLRRTWWLSLRRSHKGSMSENIKYFNQFFLLAQKLGSPPCYQESKQMQSSLHYVYRVIQSSWYQDWSQQSSRTEQTSRAKPMVAAVSMHSSFFLPFSDN